MNRKKTLGIILIIAACIVTLAVIIVLFVFPNSSNTSDPDKKSNGTGGGTVHLADDHTEFSGDGAETEGSRITIKKAGTYEIDGTLNNGQIRVKAGTGDSITLVFNNVTITNPDREAVYIKEAGAVSIELKEGTVNTVCSGSVPEQILSDDTLFSAENETALSQAAAALNPDDSAKRAAVYSKGDLTVNGTGKLRVFGYIKNGIQAKNKLAINGGEFQIMARNHGMKGNASFYMENAAAFIVAGNDGIHSDAVAELGNGGGDCTIYAQDDGIQTGQAIRVKGGGLNVLHSDEGLETNQIEISGGTLDLTADDDGMNACTADEETNEDTFPNLKISGGTVKIHAGGDGLDSNGNLLVSGGEVTIDGPSDDGNSALDSGSENNGTCKIDGGTVIAIGSSGMAEGFSESSGQCSFLYNGKERWEEGTTLDITDEKGNSLCQYVTKKTANSIVFSSPELKKGNRYTLQITDSAGKKTTETIEQESVSVSAGEPSRMGGGMGKGGAPRPDKKPGQGNDHWQKGEKPPSGTFPGGTPPDQARDFSSQN